MKIYITASNRWSALYFAENLRRAGATITSNWHDRQMERTSTIKDEIKQANAETTSKMIADSDVLLIVSDPDMVPGGKFVDVGIALQAGLTVFLVGRRENLKMHHPKIIQCDDLEGVLGNF
jgi:hypothetical protein